MLNVIVWPLPSKVPRKGALLLMPAWLLTLRSAISQAWMSYSPRASFTILQNVSQSSAVRMVKNPFFVEKPDSTRNSIE